MPNIRFPTSGSMQFWPRKKSKRMYARVRAWPEIKDSKAVGFAGYKVGMTHVLMTETNKNSPKVNKEISVPVTIIECPPLKIMGARFYKKVGHELKIIAQVTAKKLDKELTRKICPPKNPVEPKIDDIEFDDVKLIVYTQPKLAGIDKKKPEIFQMAIGGDDKLAFIKENLGKEIKLDSVFSAGDQVDIHAVTTGKGFQGPVKRFGIKIRNHRSEKTKRGPGSLGGWKAQGHSMYRIPHAGQMGFQLRTEYNKQIMKISDSPKDINAKGGFIHYGEVKTTFMLIKGSVAGTTKRLIILSHPMRKSKNIDVPQINYTSLESKQG